MLRVLNKFNTFSQAAKAFAPAKSFSTSSAYNLSQHDPNQVRSFYDENLILVDRQDQVVGKISKVDGHLNTYNKTGHAHRAFSVFLFNQNNELLIHQRSLKKITFPGLWTNSCCSHPLYNEEEMVEEGYIGARKAIRRRVDHELGHDLKEIDDLHFMGRIYYSAECDQTWGEQEIDYCFFIKRDFQDKDFKPNPDEIMDYKWIGKDEIMRFLSDRLIQRSEQVTPWFGAIMHYQLFQWWDVLIQDGAKSYQANPAIVDLNAYQKPIFKTVDGIIKSNVQI